MKHLSVKDNSKVKPHRFRKILKVIGFSFLGLIMIMLVAAVGLSVYFNKHKEVIVADLNQKINENIKGNIVIGDVGYTLVKGFPNFALTISDVVLKDSLWAQHKHTLLTAKEIEVHLNIKKLVLDKEVDIEKIKINNAIINMYIDKNGVSNSDIFKPKPKDAAAKPKRKITIDEIALDNVEFISENIQRDKLFDFDVTSLESQIDYTDTGWQTDLYINTLAKSMAFKLSKGSFIKGKRVEGKLALSFSTAENKITVVTEDLEIGGDEFDITGHFNLGKKNSLFDLDINTEILWGNASRLLSANILRTLKKFDIQKPIKVNCTIAGDMNVEGDPNIRVKAIIEDNELKLPDGKITNCAFHGEYNNEYKKGHGISDENSAVIITNLSGSFDDIPISIPKGIIYNFTTPTASGLFNSKFEAVKLNQFLHEDVMAFTGGNANVNLKFNVDIVQLKINKPTFSGSVNLNAATLQYFPKDITFQKTDVLLNFTENGLTIDKIKYTNEKNTVMVKGQIDNFFALYYKDSGKMTVNWDIYSPSIDAQQFIAMLAKNKKTAPVKKVAKKMVSTKLQSMIDNSLVNIDIKADKMLYKNLTATSLTTSIQLDGGQLFIKNGLIKTCDGNITFNAQLIPKNNLYNFTANTNIKTVDIPKFLTAFNNFGITSFQPNEIKGNLTVVASLNGAMTQTGTLVENSLKSKVNYKVLNGSLDNFEPLMKVGKVAFPKRDVKNIDFSDLNGKFAIDGELITVDHFKVSSSVLNFDVEGVYSFGKGTNLAMTIPLRNPKDDSKITDSIQRADLRYKGIVLHLFAVDGPDGKIQIKLNPQDEKTSNEIKISNPFKKSKSTKK